MKRLTLFVLLIQIVCITYSKSYVTSESFLQGGSDSVLVSVNDIRNATEKMIMLKYELKKSEIKDSIIRCDSINLDKYVVINNRYKEQNKKLIKQRNTLGITSIGLLGIIIGLIW